MCQIHQGRSVMQAAEEEVTQLYKGNAGLIDSVAELKVQVNAAARCSCHTVNNLCCMQPAGSSSCPAMSAASAQPLWSTACFLQSAVCHSDLSITTISHLPQAGVGHKSLGGRRCTGLLDALHRTPDCHLLLVHSHPAAIPWLKDRVWTQLNCSYLGTGKGTEKLKPVYLQS